MTRIRLTTTFCAFLLTAFAGIGISPKLAAAPAAPKINEDIQRSLLRRFVVDVAMDGPTWRMNDGTNPFFPQFTGQLFRGNTFIVSGKIYRGGTLKSGGDFGRPDNPAGPETPMPIGTWVCRGTFNLDIGEIAAGGFPHVTSTQVFTFDSGGTRCLRGSGGRSHSHASGHRRARPASEVPVGRSSRSRSGSTPPICSTSASTST